MWSGVRVALLTPPAKVAVLNNAHPDVRECVKGFLSKNYLDLYRMLIQPETKLHDDEEKNTSSLPQWSNCIKPMSDRKFLVQRNAPSDQLSEFVPPTEFISEREVYTRDSDRAFVVREDADLVTQAPNLPLVGEESDLVESFTNLKCFALPCGIFSALSRPTYSEGCFDFYPLDLASVLTVLMLDLQPGSRMLDFCSAPGGKAVTALQTLNLERLVCTDVSPSRLKRLHNVLTGFAYGTGSGRPGLPDVQVEQVSAVLRRGNERFTRVLVDVPCSTDRDALTSPSGGYFARGKASSRVNLPLRQKTLLRQAMSLCEVGGYVVYSTCTLSTAQNQAVIESCLADLLNDDGDGAEFAVVDASRFLDLCASQLSPEVGIRVLPAYSTNGSLLGATVVPRLAGNYGPAFICKLKRLK